MTAKELRAMTDDELLQYVASLVNDPAPMDKALVRPIARELERRIERD